MKELIFNDARSMEVQTVTETEGTLKVRIIMTTTEALKAVFLDEFATSKMTLIENHQEKAVYENYYHPSFKEEWGGIWEVELLQKEKGINGKVADLQEEMTKQVETLHKVEKDMETAQKDIEELKESSGSGNEVQVAAIQVAQIQAQGLTDEQALKCKAIYPAWEDVIGQTVAIGFKFVYDSILYKTLQDNLTIQEQYIPGEGTESLYAVLDETHAGTPEDPIPYNGNMELEEGKYYIQDETVYKCVRNTENPVHQTLAELIGIYVEVAE